MEENIDISVVVPIYRGEDFILELIGRLEQTLSKNEKSYEIILVNDYSPDNSWHRIKRIGEINKHVKGINLSRNFGQHPAIKAGLQHAVGEWIVVMDCDLQDRPEEITNFISETKNGCDIVLGVREQRKDPFLKKYSSALFYMFLGFLTDTKLNSKVANFGIYHKKTIHNILTMGDYSWFFPTMVQWVGFNVSYLKITHDARPDGRSSYSWYKLFTLSIDVILSFSDKPLRIIVKLGLLISLLSIIMSIFFLWKYFNGEILVQGYSSLILSIWFLSGIMISVMGAIGLYVGKILQQVKNRPSFIIDEKVNFSQ